MVSDEGKSVPTKDVWEDEGEGGVDRVHGWALVMAIVEDDVYRVRS